MSGLPAGALVVTGGSRGIGRATVLGAARPGACIVFSWVSDAAAAEATAEAARAAGAIVETVRGEASDATHLAALFDAAERLGGGAPGRVVVNAGIVGDTAVLADMDEARLRRIVEVNVMGALLTAREAARRMSRSRGGAGGAMVIVSSAAARLGAPGQYVDYAASKGAADTLTLGLAKELGPEGVRVNAVRPGIIATDIHASGGLPDRAAELGPLQPLGRAGEAGETAEAILWLLSDAASYVTGALLDVAGGR